MRLITRIAPRCSAECWFAAALLAASIFIGCSNYSGPSSANTINFLIESAPINLDPRFAIDAQAQDLDGLIFSSLVAHDAHMNITPDLAQSWDNPDPLTVVFHLRPGVKFHDGRSLTSADVKYTFDTILSGTPSPSGPMRSPKRGTFSTVASVEAPDPATVVFHLKTPDAALLWNMTRPGIGIVEQGSGTEERRRPVGTGPFRFNGMVTDEEVDLDRNPDYFGDATRNPDPPSNDSQGALVEHVRFRVVPEAIVRALELRKGSADIGGVNSLTADMVVALQKEKGIAVADTPGTSLTYVAINFNDPILGHREVRQALDYATDRASIIRYLVRGQARVAIGQLPPDNWAFDPNLQPRPYDPAQAGRLLDAAGFPRGPDGIRFHLTLKSSTEDVARQLGEVLADQWKQVGIALELRPLETATLLSDISHGSFQLYTLRWLGVNNNPAFYQYVFSSSMMPPNGGNRGHYSNSQLDALIAQEAAAMDRAKQKAITWQIQEIVNQDEPYINLWFNDTVCAYRDRVSGVTMSPTGDYNFLENVRLN